MKRDRITIADLALKAVFDTVKGDSESSNTWQKGGKEFFYENGREREDGAITGTVFVCEGGYITGKRSFKIAPDGTVIRFPFITGKDKKRIALEVEREYSRTFMHPKDRWKMACDFDGINPGVSFAVFSKENPYAD